MQLATDGISHYWSRQDIGWQGYRANVNAIGYKKANSPEKLGTRVKGSTS